MKKKNNKFEAQIVRKSVPILSGFDDATLCNAVANLDIGVVTEIAKVAAKREGNYENLSVHNSKTKRSAFIGIVGDELAEKVFQNPSAIGPVYNMVHYIQSAKFGSGRSAAEERAERYAAEGKPSTRKPSRVISNVFEDACAVLGFDPDNLSEWEEEQVDEYLRDF